jgi:hypothetical protein
MRLHLSAVPIVVAAVAWWFVPSPAPLHEAGESHEGPEVPARAAAALTELQFVPNRGQWHDAVRWAAFGDTAGWLFDDGFALGLERWTAGEAVAGRPTQREVDGAIVRTRFLGAARPSFEAGESCATKRHFFVGEPERWRTGVECVREVTMRGVHPGIDVRFRRLPDGRRGAFEYDLLLAAGADLSAFVAECEGVDHLRIDDQGRLCTPVRVGETEVELIQEAPIAWELTPAGERPLRVAFRLLGSRRYGFVAPDRDPGLAAVVDPGVVWGTFVGGGATDSVNSMVWKPGSGIWLGGWAGSADFPTTPGAYRTTGGADAFVARLNEAGTALVFATYIGGSASEEIRGLALGPGDTPTAVGFTGSANFPITPGAARSTYSGGSPFLDIGDAFCVRLDANGSALLGATYLGGVFDDVAEAVVVDPTGHAIVAGWTSSHDFPTTPGVVQPALGGVPAAQSDGFVCRVSPNAQSLTFSTFLGGQLSEQFLAIDRNPTTGELVIGGWSASWDYPTTLGAFRTVTGGAIDGVATRLNANGTAVAWSSYVGGIADDAIQAVRLAGDGTLWAGGFTTSTNFPTSLNAPQRVLAGMADGFVFRFSANGQAMQFSTLLGGPGPDRVRGIDVATPGVLVVGEAGSGFPVTTGAPQQQFAGGMIDGFATLLTNGGATIDWSTYFGGGGGDALGSVKLADNGLAVIAGWTFSSDFPIQPAGLQPQLRGAEDGVVLQLDLLADLGEGLRVAALTPTTPVVAADGDIDLLAIELENLTGRWLTVDGVRVLVTGRHAAPPRIGDLRVLAKQPQAVAFALVGGPEQVPGGAEIDVALGGVQVAPFAKVELRVRAAASLAAGDPAFEVAAAVVDAAAWQVSATGAGAGPSVRVLGTGRADGPVHVFGRLAGDADGNAVRTVADQRLIVTRLGTNDARVDVDGDGVLTPIDARAVEQVLLGRATLFGVPAQLARGEWLRLPAMLPDGAVAQAVLGGRVLALGRATPRELSLRIEAAHPTGLQELTITVGGRVVHAGIVDVQ